MWSSLLSEISMINDRLDEGYTVDMSEEVKRTKELLMKSQDCLRKDIISALSNTETNGDDEKDTDDLLDIDHILDEYTSKIAEQMDKLSESIEERMERKNELNHKYHREIEQIGIHRGLDGYQHSRNIKQKSSKLKKRRSRIYISNWTLRCKQCNHLFEDHSSFQDHMLTEHGEERPYRCTYCGDKFEDRKELVVHINHSHHGGPERPHQCKQCGRSFERKWDMKRHEKIHLGHKPFKCVHCKRGYSRNADMRKHQRTCKKRKTVS